MRCKTSSQPNESQCSRCNDDITESTPPTALYEVFGANDAQALYSNFKRRGSCRNLEADSGYDISIRSLFSQFDRHGGVIYSIYRGTVPVLQMH